MADTADIDTKVSSLGFFIVGFFPRVLSTTDTLPPLFVLRSLFLSPLLPAVSTSAAASAAYIGANHYPEEIRHATGGAPPPVAPL